MIRLYISRWWYIIDTFLFQYYFVYLRMRKIKLLPEEEQTLTEGYKNHPKFHFRLRCQALLLSHQGIRVKEIANIAKTRTRTIYQ